MKVIQNSSLGPDPKKAWKCQAWDPPVRRKRQGFLFLKQRERELAQSCPTLCNPMDCCPPGSLVHGIFQAWILEWVAIPFFRGSSRPRDQTPVSCTAGRFFTIWTSKEVNILHAVIKAITENKHYIVCQSSLTNGPWLIVNKSLITNNNHIHSCSVVQIVAALKRSLAI